MKQKLLCVQSLIAVALCVIMSLAFVSCSDDDGDGDKPTDKALVGKWRLTIDEGDGDVWYVEYNFKSNGDFEGTEFESGDRETFYGKWSVAGNMLTLDFYDDGEYDGSETYEYAFDGKKKLIIYDYEDEGPNVFEKR